MFEIRRIGIEKGAECQITLEPLEDASGDTAMYSAWGNMLHGASNVIWSNISLDSADSDSPAVERLDRLGVYSILVNVVFANTKGAGIKVTNQLFVRDAAGKLVRHREPESRTVKPTENNAFRWVNISIIMKKD